MPNDDDATPPSGLWQGLAVNGTHALRTDLQLTFAEGRVTGTFALRESKRRIITGKLSGSYKGAELALEYEGNNGTFEGRAQAAPKNAWILFGLITIADPESSVGTLTVYHTKEEFTIGGVWDGETFNL